ncbi:MAG: glucosaminidase domain-containing protein [Bacteroidales bacterium]|nr:glucosaminidase domain-containing protein [Bacteroidales bacterium]
MRINKNIGIFQTIALIFFLLLGLYSLANKPYSHFNARHTVNNYFSIYIMDQGQCTAQDFCAMLLFYNPNLKIEKAESLAKMYILEAQKEGVNQDIAFTQMCLETGFLTYNGNVKSHQNNFAGLGAINKDENGECFPDIQTGVRAHIQHLKAYGSKRNLFSDLVDSRFRFVKRGSALTIYDLTGKWASDKEYALKLEDLLSRLFFIRNQIAFRESLGIY